MFNTMSSTRLHSNRLRFSNASIHTSGWNAPLATHEGTDSAGLADGETAEFGNDGAREELGKEGDNTEQDRVPPGDTIVQETQVCPETGKGEVLERQVSHTIRS